MSELNLLAIDLGASSGKAFSCKYSGNRLDMSELHRFEHTSSRLRGQSYWDFIFLMDQIKKAISLSPESVSGIGVDTWGVDFGLLDRNGHLLANPRSYRDDALDGENMREALDFLGGEENVFEKTYVASLPYNSLFKLYRMLAEKDASLDAAKTILMLPNLIEYFLSGVAHSEYTVASTSQLYNTKEKRWAYEIINKLGLPDYLFTGIDRSGRILGSLASEVSSETGRYHARVISVAGHDTASAMAAVPAANENYTFISSGTWSLMGTQSDIPVEGTHVLEAKIGNEVTADGTYRPTINLPGLWILQECRRIWKIEGRSYSYDELCAAAENAPPLKSLIRPTDFMHPDDYPAKIADYCKRTGQPVPQTAAETTRCILDSLALCYRAALERLRRLGFTQDTVYIVGGGNRNKLLNQLSAQAMDIPVTTGPSEAAAAGNAVIQLEALGELSGMEQRHELITNSFQTHVYLPTQAGKNQWDDAYARFLQFAGTE